MTKDKYGLFGKRKASVVPTVCRTLAPYKKKCVKAPVVAEPAFRFPPRVVLEEVTQPLPPPQLTTDSYSVPTLPRVCEDILSHQEPSIRPAKRPVVATSANGFFNNIKGLASKPLLRIPEKPVEPPPPEPAPGSREAKLRKFIQTYF